MFKKLLRAITSGVFNKFFCNFYKEIIKEYAMKGGFPANRIEEVKNMIRPLTAE
jgi:hypothetical protein